MCSDHPYFPGEPPPEDFFLLFMIVGVPFLVPFFLRSTGEWRDLRRAIKAREAALRQYQLAHPSWTKEQVVKGFLKEGPVLPAFRFSDPAVGPIYFKISEWRDDVPRVVVAYNECKNALFDSDTMWVEQSD